jgi:hypothetical protein
MSWSFKIATIAGTQVRVHVTFALILAWFWWMHYQIGGVPAAWEGVLFILAVFACVVAHEFGHAFAARRYGIKTPDITLLPIGGLARLERMPEEPRQEFVIAVAGPAVNIVIAAIILLALGGTGQLADMAQIEDPRVNFPRPARRREHLPGGLQHDPRLPHGWRPGAARRARLAHVVAARHPDRRHDRPGHGLRARLHRPALQPDPHLHRHLRLSGGQRGEPERPDPRRLDELMVGDVMVRQYATLPRSASLAEAVEALLDTSQHEFPVVSSDGRLEGVLTRNDMIRALSEVGPHATVACRRFIIASA